MSSQITGFSCFRIAYIEVTENIEIIEMMNYKDGLSGADIPLQGLIMAIADVFYEANDHFAVVLPKKSKNLSSRS